MSLPPFGDRVCVANPSFEGHLTSANVLLVHSVGVFLRNWFSGLANLGVRAPLPDMGPDSIVVNLASMGAPKAWPLVSAV